MSLCSELRLANISTKLEIQDRPEYGNIDSLSVYNILLLPFVILKMSVTVCEYSPESCVYENNNLTIITKPPLPNYLSASIDIIVVIALYSGTVQLLHNNFSQNLPPSLKRNTWTEMNTFQTHSRHPQTPSRQPQVTLQTSSIHLPDTLQTPSRHPPLQTLSEHPPDTCQ